MRERRLRRSNHGDEAARTHDEPKRPVSARGQRNTTEAPRRRLYPRRTLTDGASGVILEKQCYLGQFQKGQNPRSTLSTSSF